jgi:ATP-dependent RNA helicase DeaD
MKKIRQVQINEKGIAKYLPSIFEEFKDINKDELITRVVSIEFNRFLDYYRNAGDLNIDFSKKDHVRTSDAHKQGSSMFINLGTMDGFDNSTLLKYVTEITSLPAEKFGRINIKGVYSFIDIEKDYLDSVLNSFRNEVYKGRKVRVDGSTGGGSSNKPFKSRDSKRYDKPGRNKNYSRLRPEHNRRESSFKKGRKDRKRR